MTKYRYPSPGRERRNKVAREKMMAFRARGPMGRQYQELVDAREEACAICGATETTTSATGRVRRLVIDHDHSTGLVRDLLCHRCNAGIGYLNDDPERAEAAAEYLRKHRDQPSGIRWYGEKVA